MLSPLLLPEELHFIFGRVATLFSKSLADSYARLEPLVLHSLSGSCRALTLRPNTLHAASSMDFWDVVVCHFDNPLK